MSEAARLLALAAALLWAAPLRAGEGLEDPTRPSALPQAAAAPAASPSTGPRWRLQSTLVADDRRLAVINGRTLARGDRVDGAQVVDIGVGVATLEADGRRTTLRVAPGSGDVKRPSG